jgi:hypothetical protein
VTQIESRDSVAEKLSLALKANDIPRALALLRVSPPLEDDADNLLVVMLESRAGEAFARRLVADTRKDHRVLGLQFIIARPRLRFDRELFVLSYDPEDEVRSFVCNAIAFYRPRNVSILQRLQADAAPDVRAGAVLSLGSMRLGKESEYVTAAADPSPAVRQASMVAVGSLPRPL